MKKRSFWRKAFSFLLLVCMTLSLFTGCAGRKSRDAMPADTPWNNGVFAIMETETGYYIDSNYFQCLKYLEKESGTEIYLCGKPECLHDGSDSCTATYRNMAVINAVLYDGAIYLYSVEDRDNVVSYNLYRASLDGTSLDKVGEVFSAENTSGAECYFMPQVYRSEGYWSSFVIHKGVAYLPFFLSFQYSLKGFVDGGIMKMDIRTGKKEQIYKMDALTSPYPQKLRGVGDYLYFDVYNSSYSGETGTLRYHIRDGEIISPYGEENRGRGFAADAVTEERIYNVAQIWDEETQSSSEPYLVARDVETGEYLGKLFPLEEKCVRSDLIIYDGMFIFCCEDDGGDEILVYTAGGELFGRIGYNFPDTEEEFVYQVAHPQELRIRISEGKLYAIRRGGDAETGVIAVVYSCPISDLADGKGEWTRVYEVEQYIPKGILQGDYWQTDAFKRYRSWLGSTLSW